MNAVPANDAALSKLFEADAALCKIGKRIRVLDAIGWPARMPTPMKVLTNSPAATSSTPVYG